MNVNIWVFSVLLLLAPSSLFSFANNEAGYDVSVKRHHNVKSGGSFVIVSTLDGKVTALDKHNGEFLWSFDAEIGPLLSSSLAKISIKQNGKTIWLIPSLKGRIFKFDGTSVESLPITADGLLSSSFKVQDGSILVGEHEVTTFGVDSHDGRLVYFCTSDGCNNLKKPNPDSDIIILKRYQKTVRSVDERNGYEKWNFSVGEFHLDISAGASKGLLAVKQPSEDCQQANSDQGCHYESLNGKYDSDFASDFRDFSKDRHEQDEEAKMQISIPEGLVTSISMNNKKWTYKFESPIANVWEVIGNNHNKLNLFDPSTVPALQEEKHVATMEPAIYLGMYDKSAYIQISNSIQRFTGNSNGVMNQLAKYNPSVRFTFRPFLASADHLTEATMTDADERAAVPGSNTRNCENNWLSFMDTSSKSLKDVGYFLKSTMPYYTLPDQSERRGKATEIIGIQEDEDGTSPIYIIYVHSIAWWKQFLIFALISVMLAFLMHIACQKYGKPQEVKPEIIATTPEPAPTKESESQNSSLSDPYESRFLHDFEPISCLGKGGFGIVLEARNKVDDCSYAVKRVRLPNKESARGKMRREVLALAKLNHNCIVRYYNAWIEEPPPGWQEEVDHTLVSNTNMSSNPFVKTRSSLPLSNTKPKFQATGSFSVQQTKDEPIGKHNISFEPTEPFSFPSIANGGDVMSFEFSDYSAERVEESALSEETSNNNQSLPFSRYSLNNKSLSIVFENSKPSQSTSSRDSAIEEDVCPKRSHRAKDGSKSSHSTPSASKRKCEQEAKITNRSTSQLENAYLYIQMELCLKETLQAWLTVNGERKEDKCLWIMQQVLSAVEYIHESNLIHRDLKPSNVFFSNDGKVKVGDFGLVTNIDDFDGESAGDNLSNYDSEESHTERVGTRLYMAPEQMNSRNYSKKVDIYATGIILIELFTPFSTHMERVDVLKKARKGIFDKNFSNSYRKQSKLAKSMLSSEPQHRPTALEALQDDVFNSKS